jgi:antitoxin ParD1/3/4
MGAMSMTVEIPSEFQPFVEGIIAQGNYADESQVVGEALRLLRERDRRLDELRKEVRIGTEQLDRGEFTDYDDESLKDFFAEIKVEGRRSLNLPESGK